MSPTTAAMAEVAQFKDAPIEPGQFFTLKNGGTHLLLNKGYRYGYIEDGKISLCD